MASKLFFAYGSTVSQSDMRSRCPNSVFYSIAVLRNHRWFVNERGYANIAPSVANTNLGGDVVWGVLYRLKPFDEELLDKSEGLPWSYTKVDMDIEAITIAEDARNVKREMVTATVYIDHDRVQDSYPFPDFVTKMNRGIEEGIERGIPRTWIDRVVRSFLVLGEGDDPGPNGVSSPKPGHEADKASVAPSHKALSIAGSRSGDSEARLASSVPPPNASQDARQARGLEDSIYAQQVGAIGDSRSHQNHQPDQPEPAPISNVATRGGSRGKKQFTCWWWKTQGSCRFTEDQCQFAHRDTGNPINPPGGKKFLERAANETAYANSNLPAKKGRPDRFERPAQRSYNHSHGRGTSYRTEGASNPSWSGPGGNDSGWGTAGGDAAGGDNSWGGDGAGGGDGWSAPKKSDKPKSQGLSWADDEEVKPKAGKTNDEPVWEEPSDNKDEQW